MTIIAPVETMVEIIKSGISLLRSEVDDLKKMRCISLSAPGLDNFKRNTLWHCNIRYLELFIDTNRFLLHKLERDDESPDLMRFYLNHLRTVLEIYAHLVFLSSQDVNKQVALCAGKILETLCQIESSRDSLEAPYEEVYRLYEPFFNEQGLTIPPSIHNFSIKVFKKHKLVFPNVKEMLAKDLVVPNSPLTTSAFPSLTNDIYNQAYRWPSNYIHGNLLTLEVFGNERFWILGRLPTFLSLMMELVDIKMLSNGREGQIRDWFETYRANCRGFADVWTVKSWSR